MVVHVVGARRVVLNNTVAVIPEGVFKRAHLVPGGQAIRQAHTNVLPPFAVAGNDFEWRAPRASRDEEHAVVAAVVIAGKKARSHAMLVRYVEAHDSAPLVAGFRVANSTRACFSALLAAVMAAK